MQENIIVKGARENNLKNIDVSIPRDKLTVITGLSGSGKSSLAFDTIYAEGQRRYVESLSSYARMFLGQKEKPDVDYIDGLSPAISIDQKTTSQNPRSTVGTVTEIYDYLRLLWARVGTPHCPNCGKEIKQQTIDQIVDQVMALGEGTRIQVMAPVIRGKKGEYAKVFEDARKSGYVRVRVDGSMYDLSEEIKLEKNIKHSIEVVVDRLILKPDVVHRLSDSAETAAALSGGLVLINVLNPEQDILFSQNYACEDCGVSIEELTPRMFSFNNPFGACPACTGLGSQLKVDPELVIPNKTLSILDGAICASGWNNVRGDGISRMYFDALSKKYHFSLREPVEKLSPEVMDVILYGTKGEKLELHYDQPRGKGVLYQPFEGIVNNLERRYQETQSESVRAELEECMSECPCPACQGRRLRRESLAVTVGGMDIDTFTRMSVTEEIAFVDSLALTEQQLRIGERILKEIKNRLGFLQSVGLDYLTLSRASATLSGGESQRIRLATQIGSSLMGVLYILDEPSIGLHQRDNDKLLATLKRLRDLGNTLIVVEHDEDTMRAADYIVDIGPGAGVHGGRVVAAGTPAEVMANEASLDMSFLPLAFLVFTVLLFMSNLYYFYEIFTRQARADSLEKAAYEDPVTGLYNRAYSEKRFKELSKKKTPFLLINMDLNGLKKTNDTYGHEVGDRLIFRFATALSEGFSDIGETYRMGGDEFMVLVAEPDMKKVREAFQKLFERTEAYSYGLPTKLSFAYGMAASGQFEDVPEEHEGKRAELVYQLADQKMYAMKQAQKNTSQSV